MATTFFPTVTDSTVSYPVGTGALEKVLSLSRGAGVQSFVDNTAAGLATHGLASLSSVTAWGSNGGLTTIATGTAGENWNTNSRVWISPALAAVTISGTITVNIRGLESNAMANYGACAFVYKLTADQTTLTRFALGDSNTEFGTGETAQNFTLTPTSTALVDGDYLVFVPAYFGAGTSASGFTATGFYAGASGATGDTFITFTETITLAPTSRSPRNPAIDLIDPALV